MELLDTASAPHLIPDTSFLKPPFPVCIVEPENMRFMTCLSCPFSSAGGAQHAAQHAGARGVRALGACRGQLEGPQVRCAAALGSLEPQPVDAHPQAPFLEASWPSCTPSLPRLAPLHYLFCARRSSWRKVHTHTRTHTHTHTHAGTHNTHNIHTHTTHNTHTAHTHTPAGRHGARRCATWTQGRARQQRLPSRPKWG